MRHLLHWKCLALFVVSLKSGRLAISRTRRNTMHKMVFALRSICYIANLKNNDRLSVMLWIDYYCIMEFIPFSCNFSKIEII